MKSLIFGDVHSNLAALEAVLEHEGSWDDIIFLGDAVIGGPQPAEVLSLLSKLKGFFLMGNHDEEVLKVDVDAPVTNPNKLWVQWTRKQISDKNLEFIKTFVKGPYILDNQGRTFSLIHGCLSRELGYRFWPDSQETIYAELVNMNSSPCILIGHSHVQFMKRHKQSTILNPGGLGQPRLGKPLAGYAVLENGELYLRSVKYDFEKTCRAMDNMPLDKDFIEQWKRCYRTGILPSMYNIRNFEPLMEQGYL